jgi:hypothetical protein
LRDNRSDLEKHNIRFSGKPLGRPPKATTENQDELKRLKAQRRQEYRERIPIEGKFGQGKYGYRLNSIRARRAVRRLPMPSTQPVSIVPTSNGFT